MNVTVHMAEAQADQTRKLPRSDIVHLQRTCLLLRVTKT